MKYGILDTDSGYWVKRNYKDHLPNGITMTQNKSDALASESDKFIIKVMVDLTFEFLERPSITDNLKLVEMP
jgi:hypothetical protein